MASESGRIWAKGWETLVIQVTGLEEGGWDEWRGRAFQGGGQKWGELSVLTLPHVKVPLLVGILMTTQHWIFKKSFFFRLLSCSWFVCTNKADRDVSVLQKIHSR